MRIKGDGEDQRLRPLILIVTIHDDLHALVVQEHVRAADLAECHIIECDRIGQRLALSYEVTSRASDDRVLTSEGLYTTVSRADVVWLRTGSARQVLAFDVEDDTTRSLIDNDSRAALAGLFSSRFNGRWISTPEATLRASDKIGQLRAAWEVGFHVPRTLVSQSRAAVENLLAETRSGIVVKTVAGVQSAFLETVKLGDIDALDDESFAAAPAIYQEYIPGDAHLRLNCFGDESHAAIIQTDDVDWRKNLNVPIAAFEVPDSLHRSVRQVLDHIGLAMGIVDLKIENGDYVWLEVNPQGQFLFLDALTELDLARSLARFLTHEAEASRRRERPDG